MNIERIVEILKKEKYTVPNSYLDYINKYVKVWEEWYRGHVRGFHDYKETAGQRKSINRTRSTLYMAKTVAEDWASFLLNEKTFIKLDDSKSSIFLVGDDAEQEYGLFGKNKFWLNANKLVERAFALGTAAIVLTLDNATLDKKGIVRGDIKMKYIKNPQRIIPLRFEDGDIIDVAIVTTYEDNEKAYFNVQVHEKQKDSTYKVTNREFEYGNYQYKEIKFKGIKSFETRVKLFTILSPNIENNYCDDVPLGVSIYATAIDCFKSADLAYTNFDKDFMLGGKKVFITQDGVAQVVNADGEYRVSAEDTVDNTLFTILPKDIGEESKLFEEYNPQIRVEENTKGIQTSLDLVSVKCKLGVNFYNFDNENQTVYQNTASTKASNEALVKSVSKQRISIFNFLKEVVEGVLFLAKELGEDVKEDSRLSITFDDSFFSDATSERLRDMQEVRSGLMNKWEFRVRWYGETEEEAKKALASEDTTQDNYDMSMVFRS